MPRAVPFSINYFRPVVNQRGVTFDHVLQACDAIPADGPDRSVPHGGYTLRLSQLSFAGGMWRGDISHIDYDRLPLFGDASGRHKVVKLDETEGVVDAAAFLYDPALNVLAVERRVTGATLTRFAAYFEKSGTMSASLELRPVLRSDAYDKFQRTSRVTRAHVKVAGGLRGQAFNDAPAGVREQLEAAQALDSPTLESVFSVGLRYRTDELETNPVKRAVNWFRSQSADGALDVAVLKISGETDDGEAVRHLDLIESRMRDRVSIVPNDQRLIPYAVRVAQLTDSFAQKRDVLESMFT